MCQPKPNQKNQSFVHINLGQETTQIPSLSQRTTPSQLRAQRQGPLALDCPSTLARAVSYCSSAVVSLGDLCWEETGQPCWGFLKRRLITPLLHSYSSHISSAPTVCWVVLQQSSLGQTVSGMLNLILCHPFYHSLGRFYFHVTTLFTAKIKARIRYGLGCRELFQSKQPT